MVRVRASASTNSSSKRQPMSVKRLIRTPWTSSGAIPGAKWSGLLARSQSVRCRTSSTGRSCCPARLPSRRTPEMVGRSLRCMYVPTSQWGSTTSRCAAAASTRRCSSMPRPPAASMSSRPPRRSRREVAAGLPRGRGRTPDGLGAYYCEAARQALPSPVQAGKRAQKTLEQAIEPVEPGLLTGIAWPLSDHDARIRKSAIR
jgi:hypothetical protein